VEIWDCHVEQLQKYFELKDLRTVVNREERLNGGFQSPGRRPPGSRERLSSFITIDITVITVRQSCSALDKLVFSPCKDSKQYRLMFILLVLDSALGISLVVPS
jgi:hypothetical protein